MTPAEKAVVEAARKRPWHGRNDEIRWCVQCDDLRNAEPGEPVPHAYDCAYIALDAALDALEREGK